MFYFLDFWHILPFHEQIRAYKTGYFGNERTIGHIFRLRAQNLTPLFEEIYA